ncbi:MAG: hypothetical protein GWN00_01015 [Aliifodinibius sp.]|nr:hypothetical protein [Fodinibius sp.]NIV09911.1 hypothetical protein [Fodinibius sp.]NIY23441.1 hypothetical protein [Fodinibius sp.]
MKAIGLSILVVVLMSIGTAYGNPAVALDKYQGCTPACINDQKYIVCEEPVDGFDKFGLYQRGKDGMPVPIPCDKFVPVTIASN